MTAVQPTADELVDLQPAAGDDSCPEGPDAAGTTAIIRPVQTEVREGSRTLFDVDLVPQLRSRRLDEWCTKALPADCEPEVASAVLAAWRRRVIDRLLTKYGLEWRINVGIVVTERSWNYSQVIDIVTRVVGATPIVVPKVSAAPERPGRSSVLLITSPEKSRRARSKKRKRKRK
ncbi:hypothetical protein [Fodinicola acaciae]|uniref:hypothetical protein n=1 Tax=Fodinicola acaciae TaxID=2681555 RepID=UPI0013D465F7|nr:hypothetical protein [Fodinicola acaciae]